MRPILLIIAFVLASSSSVGSVEAATYFGVEVLQLPGEAKLLRRTEVVPSRRRSLTTWDRRSDLPTRLHKQLSAPRRLLRIVAKSDDPCADLRGIPHARCVFEKKRMEDLAQKRERRVKLQPSDVFLLPEPIERSYNISEWIKVRKEERLKLEQ